MTFVRFSTFPRTIPPQPFAAAIVQVFRHHEPKIGTETREKGLTSDEVLSVVGPSLLELGFQVELGKKTAEKIKRPVYFGENGRPSLQYQIDAYHAEWRCGLEVEAGRAWMGNAVYRDLIQAMIMVEVDHLVLAVSNGYRYLTNSKAMISRDYENLVSLADSIYGHTRVRLPFTLTVVGY